MKLEHKKALDLIIKFIPKNFGVVGVQYKVEGNVMDIRYIVKEDNAQNLINYLNSLTSLIGNSFKGVKITSSVYLDNRMRKLENFEKVNLLYSINKAGVCA